MLYFWSTSLIVYLGVVLGYYYLPRQPHPPPETDTFLDAFASWDGRWYAKIASEGYFYAPEAPSTVAHFPCFPLLGRLVMELTHCSPVMAVLLVANSFLAGTFVLLFFYARLRFGNSAAYLPEYTLLAFGLWPVTFFFRMTYSESLFMFLCVLSLYGMERKWPLFVIAAIIGVATGTRPVGVGLVLPFVVHIWDRSHDSRLFILRLGYLVPLACWGLAGYMVYQSIAFGEPLAFAKTQESFRYRPKQALVEKVDALVTLEPLWSAFDPFSPCYWKRQEQAKTHPLFSLQAANPIYFLLTAAAIALGTWKG